MKYVSTYKRSSYCYLTCLSVRYPFNPAAVSEMNMPQKIPLTITYPQRHGLTTRIFVHTKQCYKATVFFYLFAKNSKAKMVKKCHDVRSQQPPVIKRDSYVFFQSRRVDVRYINLLKTLNSEFKKLRFDCNNAVQHIQTRRSPLKTTVTTRSNSLRSDPLVC